MATPRTVVVGDVHGCLSELEDLLERCRLAPADRLVFVGDLVAKGPNSSGVVALARRLAARAVLGNHEARILQWRRAILRDESPPILKPSHRLVCESLAPDDWAWLTALPLWLELPEHNAIVVHGGLRRGVPLRAQRQADLLTARSVRPDGTLTSELDGGPPWGSQWDGPQHVYFGHDAVRGHQQHRFATGLDTGCVYGKRLSAMVLPERALVQVDAHRIWCSPR